jgi:putative molybdopterin biosynthesis protein
LVTLVHRQQGLIVAQENPKNIGSLDDLTRDDVQFINRQTGAGTRVLLDYHLDLKGIESSQIEGYDQEEYTHLAVAAAVASGRADCGLGIAAAAQALDLSFLPLFQERYDLVIPVEHADTALVAPLLELLKLQQFRDVVSGLPGYDTSEMGNLVATTE